MYDGSEVKGLQTSLSYETIMVKNWRNPSFHQGKHHRNWQYIFLLFQLKQLYSLNNILKKQNLERKKRLWKVFFLDKRSSFSVT